MPAKDCNGWRQKSHSLKVKRGSFRTTATRVGRVISILSDTAKEGQFLRRPTKFRLSSKGRLASRVPTGTTRTRRTTHQSPRDGITLACNGCKHELSGTARVKFVARATRTRYPDCAVARMSSAIGRETAPFYIRNAHAGRLQRWRQYLKVAALQRHSAKSPKLARPALCSHNGHRCPTTP